MFRRIFWLVITVPLAILVMALAVANRQQVSVSFDPIGGNDPALTFSMPVFLLVVLGLLAGIVLGGAAVWLKQGKWRKAARARAREAERWREQAEEIRRRAQDPARPALASPSSDMPVRRAG